MRHRSSVPRHPFGSASTRAPRRSRAAPSARTSVMLAVALLAAGLPPGAPASARPGSAPPAASAVGPALEVDLTADRQPISPHVYGMNFADEALADELDLPVRRWGGNATTRYHYRYDTTNRASDWFFENIAEANDDPGALPDGSTTDRFVEQDRRTGADTILTVPLIGWAPKARDGSCGFSVAKYGPQQRTDEWRPDCGNGLRPDGTQVTGNDPLDTSVPVGGAYVRDWIGHLTSRYGTAAEGGVPFYSLDNEPDIWHSTHRDVHPLGASAAELRDRAYEIGAAVKAADPSAATLGPVGWGWTSWDYSGLDQETCGRTGCWADPPDREARDGLPFTTWYLREMKRYADEHGVRVLDYFDMHFYPQAPGVAFGNGSDPATNALRLRSTRSLWDPSYLDESWINTQVRLVPRMREAVAANYPGTKTAITEYNWGALDHVNGALTQADVLGIFGREGLDLATLWAPPSADQPGAYAFRMYRNYDGAGGRFGDVAVRATSADREKISVYGAERSTDGALTLMVVNKSGVDQTSSVSVRGRFARQAKVYQYSVADLTSIAHLPDQPIMVPPPYAGAPNGLFSRTFPADSVTLFVIEKPPVAVPSVAVAHQNFDWSPTDNQLKPGLRLDHLGGVPVELSRLTLRYWFTRDGGTASVNVWCDWAEIGCANVTRRIVALPAARPGADGYLEVGFTTDAGTLSGSDGTGPIKLRAARADWAPLPESNDHSWLPAATSYAVNPRVTVYLDGTRIAGTEP
ncbi:glycoside hydrolase family 44 protein [Micromonospora sp. NPDC050397]|uniref:glycoside hydrolase family 44 protein n=1 Tax=Micromonospora sp. NPDC050397 TaxID=3364279 RepID=UPI00384F0282